VKDHRRGQADRISKPSRFTRQPGYSSAVTYDDSQKTLQPNQPKLFVELAHIDYHELVFHKLSSLALLVQSSVAA
jgi:hypothetical protein